MIAIRFPARPACREPGQRCGLGRAPYQRLNNAQRACREPGQRHPLQLLADMPAQLSEALRDLREYGLCLPFLEHPSQIVRLIYGEDIDLVRFEAPLLDASAGVSYEFRLVPTPIKVTFGGHRRARAPRTGLYDSRPARRADHSPWHLPGRPLQWR